jgi:PhoH-like ATPase
MRKFFVVDTSVLIHDPEALTKFGENHLVIPYIVVHELDMLRKSQSERGVAARRIMRQLESIRLRMVESASRKVLVSPNTEAGCTLSFEDPHELGVPHHELSEVSSHVHDDLIIDCAKDLIWEAKGAKSEVKLISKDIGLRVKASLMGVAAEDYQQDKVEEGYTGIRRETIILPLDHPDDLLDGSVKAPEYLLENQFCYVQAEGYENVPAILMRRKRGQLKVVGEWSHGISGIGALDDEQRMALEVLMDEDVTCVALLGVAGCGKTLLSLAAALQQLDHSEVERIVAIKPVVSVNGRDIGYLKGDKEEKLSNWHKPFSDNLKVIQMYSGKGGNGDLGEAMLMDGRLELEAITFMRGRHLHGKFVIVDETQNCSIHEMRTVLTRTGEKSQLALLADTSQIDLQYLDAQSCGIAQVVDKLKGDPEFAVVKLERSQRSSFAQLAANKLSE